MRIRRRGTDAPPNAQVAPSSQTRCPPAPAAPVPARASTPCSETTARWVEPPPSQANPLMCEATPVDHRPPSQGRNRQEEEKKEEVEATENEKGGKEDGRSEHEHGGPVHVVCSTRAVPKGEDEERRAEVEEKASEDSTRVKDEEASTVAICKKGDGKGWQCKKPAQSGYSLCQYHLEKLRSYASRSQQKKPKVASPTEKPTAAGIHLQGAPDQQKKIKRRRMEEHVSTRTGTGLRDSFYYYSGFGPRWGKRRGDRSADVMQQLQDGGASDQVHPVEDTSEAAAAAVATAGAEDGEEDEYDCEGPSRDGKPWKCRPLSSLL